MIYDAGDPKAVAPKKKRWQLEQERKAEEFRAVINTREGRATIWRILELCGMYRQSYTGDVNTALFNEGSRKVGLEIRLMFDELKDEGDRLYSEMAEEAKDRERKVTDNV